MRRSGWCIKITRPRFSWGAFFCSSQSALVWVSWTEGLPPHRWGIRLSAVDNLTRHGITPIYMGNTQWVLTRKAENTGSHPLTWGTPLDIKKITLSYRITPIFMGNTLPAFPHPVQLGDHPHLLGEYCSLLALIKPATRTGIIVNYLRASFKSFIAVTPLSS